MRDLLRGAPRAAAGVGLGLWSGWGRRGHSQ
jgi:hypothetical protein